MPLCLTPPKGIRGSDFTTPFTSTMPDSIWRTSRSARFRSWVRRGTKGIPDTEHPDLFDELRGELLCDGVYDEEPLRGDARLSRVHEAAGDRPFRRGVEVGVVRDDERIRPAKFQDGLLQVLRGLLSHLHAGPDGAGQADEGDGRIDQGRGRGPVAAKSSAAQAHFSTSATASRITLPISSVIVSAYVSLCFRRISAKRSRYAARSFGSSLDQDRKASRAAPTFVRTCGAVRIG